MCSSVYAVYEYEYEYRILAAHPEPEPRRFILETLNVNVNASSPFFLFRFGQTTSSFVALPATVVATPHPLALAILLAGYSGAERD
jgi:hypothetical protein